MSVIRTAEDWWAETNARWQDILEIFGNCGAPLDDTKWCDGIQEPATEHDETFVEMLTRLKDAKDGQALSRWFNLCWVAAPDRRDIHSWPSWGVFCDLCSENWVFEQDQVSA